MQPYYQDEWVTLYHGDCLEVDAWLAADVLVTDPPYGVAWVGGGIHWYVGRRVIPQEKRRVIGDADSSLRDAMLAQWGSRPAVVFGSWRVARPDNVAHRLIWHKQGRQPGVGTAAWYSTDEEIYIIGAGFIGKPAPTVLTTSEIRNFHVRDIGHPTPKPVALMESLIAKCPPGVVADPFAGSGSTLVAAKALGRKAVGVELDERYCEIAAKRLAQDVLSFVY